MPRTRMETNVRRLLSKCEAMALDVESVPWNWRLHRFLIDLDCMLLDLKDAPNAPDRDTYLSYKKRLEFLQKITSNCKHANEKELSRTTCTVDGMITAPESTALSQDPVSVNSLYSGTTSMSEIKNRHAAKFSQDARKELFGDKEVKENFRGGECSQRDMDQLIEYHHSLQEKIADHMLDLTRTLKEQTKAAGEIVKKDIEELKRSNATMDQNQGTLLTETEKLEKYNQRACKCWVWFMLIVVCSVFIFMVLFMKMFKKKIPNATPIPDLPQEHSEL